MLKKIYNEKKYKKITIVSAVYGVKDYIDEFVNSIVEQSIGFKSNIELILVDDCSNDGSYEKCLKWQRKYPKNIIVDRLPINKGQAGARNRGIELATNRWINFADPDDILHANFFRHLMLAMDKNSDCVMFSGQFRSYYEATGHDTNDHPLGWRYKKDIYTVDVTKEAKAIHLTVNNTIFDINIIRKHSVKFDERVKPALEDALFVNQYTMRGQDHKRCFVEKARYLYRKRSAGDSTLDTAWSKKEKFKNQIVYGQLAMLTEAKEIYGYIPLYIQNTVIYDISWYFRKLNKFKIEKNLLNESELNEFYKSLKMVLKLIPSRSISNYNTTPMPQDIRKQLTYWGGKEWRCNTVVNIIDSDIKNKMLKVSYVRTPSDDVDLVDNFSKIKISNKKDIPLKIEDKVCSLRRYEWIELGELNEKTDFCFMGTPVKFSTNGKHIQDRYITNLELLKIAKTRGLKATPSKIEESTLSKARKLGQWNLNNCWLLMDRDTQADDNAEHLYRYIINETDLKNVYFVLNRDSHDWARLESEGFQMIDYGSELHTCAIINAEHILSSHADEYITGGLNAGVYGEFLKYKFHFLQHGVTQGDLSEWLNNKKIDTIFTASECEYESFVNGEKYSFTKENVVNTGFPRHDTLKQKSDLADKNKVIAIMPTWRKWLVSKPTSNSGKWGKVEGFNGTTYYQNWNRLLNSEEIERLHKIDGYRVVFFPHANMLKYVEDFDMPEFIEIHSAGEMSIQNTLAESEFMITDYSSVAFEMAALRKPVIYFQFDHNNFFQGGHISNEGYFDYHRDGFGPCCQTLDSLKAVLTHIASSSCPLELPVYKERAKAFLPTVDGKASQRVLNRILSM